MHENGSIFIADNDVKTRDLVSAFLTYQGYNITITEGSASFFDTIQKNNVDIVIADLTYLQNIAPDFKERILAYNPLLALIGYGDAAATEIKKTVGDTIFTLPKPLNLDELESLDSLDNGSDEGGDGAVMVIVEVEGNLEQRAATQSQSGIRLEDEPVVKDGVRAHLVEPVAEEGVDRRVTPTGVNFGGGSAG